jgi:ppGpp synthetase/RelA/SpoT-type nucleotidyltranferase
MTTPLNRNDLKRRYDRLHPDFDRLLKHARDSIELFLNDSGISFLSVTGRIKTFESLMEKIERKAYGDPFSENEDFVAIRVIVYFPDDIDRVCSIIDNEFEVAHSENKSDTLSDDTFGYRSFHKVVSIKRDWANAPQFRKLHDIKCEIQIRTILMHAWAEIEHKLQYKSTESAPSPLRRRLFRLSAKFEEADEQFQALREQINEYQTNLEVSITTISPAVAKREINAETLSRYLRSRYPEREDPRDISSYDELIHELKLANFETLDQLEDILLGTDGAAKAYEVRHPPISGRYNVLGITRAALSIKDEDFLNVRIAKHPSSRSNIRKDRFWEFRSLLE